MEERRLFKVVFLSILLHLLILLLWEDLAKLNLIGDDKKLAIPAIESPIVFDLQQPNPPLQVTPPPQTPQTPAQQRLPNEVIATPDDAKVVEKQTRGDFLSDKNAVARNPETNLKLKIGDAFSKGDFNSHDLPVPHGPVGEPQVQPQPQQQPQQPQTKPKTLPELKEKKESPQKEKPKDKEADKNTERENAIFNPEDTPRKNIAKEKPTFTPEDLMVENSSTAFYKEFVLKRPSTMNAGVTQQFPGIAHNQQDSRAEDMGGLSFNTYNWEYAPYLLMLKSRIQGNIFPPVAFSQLGLIDGETLIRFKIYPNGQMRDLVVLKYVGHESLKDTSYKAVEISAPFPPLPKDFPEPFLEITGRFMYVVRR